MHPRKTLRSQWVSSIRRVRRYLYSTQLQGTNHSLCHPWLVRRWPVAFSLLLLFHYRLDLLRGYGRLDGKWDSALDVLVADDLKRCALLQRLHNRSKRLVLAHLGELTDLLDINGLVLLASNFVEQVCILGKVLIREVVLNLLTVSWKLVSGTRSNGTCLSHDFVSLRMLCILWWLGFA